MFSGLDAVLLNQEERFKQNFSFLKNALSRQSTPQLDFVSLIPAEQGNSAGLLCPPLSPVSCSLLSAFFLAFRAGPLVHGDPIIVAGVLTGFDAGLLADIKGVNRMDLPY